jgi:hypothetical protein
MRKSFQDEINRLSFELERLRVAVHRRKQQPHEPWLDKVLDFWLESARFRIAELGIYNEEGDMATCDKAARKAQEALQHLHLLLK